MILSYNLREIRSDNIEFAYTEEDMRHLGSSIAVPSAVNQEMSQVFVRASREGKPVILALSRTNADIPFQILKNETLLLYPAASTSFNDSVYTYGSFLFWGGARAINNGASFQVSVDDVRGETQLEGRFIPTNPEDAPEFGASIAFRASVQSQLQEATLVVGAPRSGPQNTEKREGRIYLFPIPTQP